MTVELESERIAGEQKWWTIRGFARRVWAWAGRPRSVRGVTVRPLVQLVAAYVIAVWAVTVFSVYVCGWWVTVLVMVARARGRRRAVDEARHRELLAAGRTVTP